MTHVDEELDIRQDETARHWRCITGLAIFSFIQGVTLFLVVLRLKGWL